MVSAIMTEAEIVAQLRRIRYRPTIASVSRDSGVSRTSLYQAIRTGALSDKHAKMLMRALHSDRYWRLDNPRSPQPVISPSRPL